MDIATSTPVGIELDIAIPKNLYKKKQNKKELAFGTYTSSRKQTKKEKETRLTRPQTQEPSQ